jgi:CBS domain-containing protein
MEQAHRMVVGDMLEEPVLAEPLMSAGRVAALLEARGAYEAFIPQRERVGVVTIRGLLGAREIGNTKVTSLMVFAPRLTRSNTLAEAARLMSEHRLRALPVVDRNTFVGAVSLTSIVRALRDVVFGTLPASKAMTHHPVTIAVRDTASKARLMMLRRKFDHLPVMDASQLRGVVTSSHLVFQLIAATASSRYAIGVPETRRRLETRVGEVMNAQPLLVEPTMSLRAVADAMGRTATCALVGLHDEVQGILTYRDFAKVLATQEGRGRTVPAYIIGLPEDPFEAEAAKLKFERMVDGLQRSFADLLEARSTIKARQSGNGQRRRYEVRVVLKTPRRVFAQSVTGWDLPSIYDEIVDRFKRMLAGKGFRGREPRGGPR